jgi:hypothetical protein
VCLPPSTAEVLQEFRETVAVSTALAEKLLSPPGPLWLFLGDDSQYDVVGLSLSTFLVVPTVIV